MIAPSLALREAWCSPPYFALTVAAVAVPTLGKLLLACYALDFALQLLAVLLVREVDVPDPWVEVGSQRELPQRGAQIFQPDPRGLQPRALVLLAYCLM